MDFSRDEKYTISLYDSVTAIRNVHPTVQQSLACAK